jgi:hypothetical protein
MARRNNNLFLPYIIFHHFLYHEIIMIFWSFFVAYHFITAPAIITKPQYLFALKLLHYCVTLYLEVATAQHPPHPQKKKKAKKN